MTTPTIHRGPDKQAVARVAAEALVETIDDRLQNQDEVHIALTGGSMGTAIITAVSELEIAGAVDWARVVVWWGDERYLPLGDPERNDTQNDAGGLAQLGLLPSHVHRVAGPDHSENVEASARSYGAELRDSDARQFDIVLLGVGPDGHVASLFPHHPAQRIVGNLVSPVTKSPKPPPERVTLTFECLNRAREVWFLVAGADKADAVKRALAPDADRWDVPAAGVHGTEQTVWWIDEAAAAQLD